jgi:hypothetical protein
VPDTSAPALTVPAAVADALLEGEQIVDLRIEAAAGGPPEGARRFWLRADPGAGPALKPAYRRARELSLHDDDAGSGGVRIAGWAELAGAATTVVDEKAREALDGKTILDLDALAGREVRVLVLRAHRLVEPLTVAAGGLAGLPADPAAGPPSEPALSDTAFEARYNGLANALPGGLAPPA